MRVQLNGRFEKVEVTADGEGTVAHAGSALLVAVADKLGLTAALSQALSPARERRSAHDPGVVIRDLAVMLCDGGDCLSDLGALRDQEDLFGRVASNATAWRAIDALGGEGMLERLRRARARARERAWALGARPERVVFDIDATLLCAHSDKEQAAGTYKGGFGFHPLCCFIDETEEAPAAILRPGNAGANTAADHIEVFDRALEQLPREVAERAQLVVRCDSAGATHAFTDHLHAARVGFSVGFDLTEDVRQAVGVIADQDWVQAIGQDGAERDRAFVAELSLELAGWPPGTRAICRKERAHPGAQLSLIDTDGFRHQVFITDLDGEIAELDRFHRARARCEDRVRAAKDTGMRNLPFRDFDANEAWLELSLIAQDLLAWTRSLALDGSLARAEPKRLRYRLLHQAGRIARSGRRTQLRLQRSWPWAQALATAFARIRVLPAAAP
ncbi:MAG: IS1380 family transposase [Thermoleophilaceae bacterium]